MKDKQKREITEEDTGIDIIHGTPFCECGALMVCLDGVELICPVCNRKKELKIAEQIAREVHKSQKRWDGKDYITHPEAVANSFDDIDTELKIVAWLHDVLEDSDLTVKDLLEKGISYHLALSVEYLTREKDQNYKDYILQVKEDEIATKVKIADLKHNLLNLKNGSMRDKYMLAMYILKLD